jgi:hypothetical protein
MPLPKQIRHTLGISTETLGHWGRGLLLLIGRSRYADTADRAITGLRRPQGPAGEQYLHFPAAHLGRRDRIRKTSR